jgi:predicted nucleotidyltransferase
MTSIAEPLLQQYVEACTDVFGDRLIAIVLHGSSVKGGFIAGYSDIDFMVFLAPACFDEFGMDRELAFDIQRRTSAIDWRSAGALYFQAYYYNPDGVPGWWTGPIPGAHRVLCGVVPAHLVATPERLRETGRDFLVYQLPSNIASSVSNWADAMDSTLARRVRLIGTAVNPALYALLAIQADDPIAVWTRPRSENLLALDALHPDIAAHARRYFALAPAFLNDAPHDAALANEAYAAALDMLIAAHRAALTREASATSPP